MLKLTDISREHDDAGAFHAYINVSHFIDEQTLYFKTGAVGQIIKTCGVDAEGLDHDQRNQVARRIEAAFKHIDHERIRIYQYILKRDNPDIPARDYTNPVVRDIIDARRRHVLEGATRVFGYSVYVLIICELKKRGRSLFEQVINLAQNPKKSLGQVFSFGRAAERIESDIASAQQMLTQRVESFLVQLSDLTEAQVLGRDEAFRFLRTLYNPAPYKAQSVRLKRDSNLDEAVCDSELSCYRDHLRFDDEYVKVLTLKEPPSKTFPHMFGALQQISSNLTAVSEWHRSSTNSIRREIRSRRRHHHNAKTSLLNYMSSSQPDASQVLTDESDVAHVTELGKALVDQEINDTYWGKYSLTIVLHDKSLQRLERSVAECFKVFANYDAVLIEERYNLVNAFFAAFPGNYDFNLRYLYLSNGNQADQSFLFSVHPGDLRNKHLNDEYLTFLTTKQDTLYYLNLHQNGVLNTFVIGATGSGKSVLIQDLFTHSLKYEPEPLVMILDFAGSHGRLTELAGGKYLRLGGAKMPPINPLSLPPTPENLRFLSSFVRLLIESGGNYRFTQDDQQDLAERIASVYELDPSQRRLLTLSNILKRGLGQHLRPWVQSGEYGELFDHAEDNLTFARLQCFDFEGLDTVPRCREALTYYLLHRMSERVRDPRELHRLKLVLADEAWRFLEEETTRNYLHEVLKTWRKKNGGLILATQSIDDLSRNEMLRVVVESCPTKLFLANPDLDRSAYADVFHLNETELDLITALTPRREFVIKNPQHTKVLNLSLDPLSYWLYTTTPAEVQRRAAVFEQHGTWEGLRILAGQNL